MPKIVTDDDPDGEEVKIGLIDKSFVVDENLNLELKLDSNKMSDKELTSSEYVPSPNSVVTVFISCVSGSSISSVFVSVSSFLT